jgi:hypothetical protein
MILRVRKFSAESISSRQRSGMWNLLTSANYVACQRMQDNRCHHLAEVTVLIAIPGGRSGIDQGILSIEGNYLDMSLIARR